ncbi:MAG: SDR family oxidoreductase [Anaerolineae bacterium]
MSRLQGKVAFITGATSGIGFASALEFAGRGCHVVATGLSEEALQPLVQAVAALPAPHGDLLALVADVRDAGALNEAASAAEARFGRLDILLANAGVGQRGSIADSAWAELETLLRTNIDGVLHSIRACVPAMRKAGGGRIIVISSISAGVPMPYAATYGASKTFVSSIAASLRYELEPDHITVTELRLGRVATPFNQNRLGAKGYSAGASTLPTMTPERVAQAIADNAERPRKTVILRWFDWLTRLVGLIAPGYIARKAMRQYRV